MYKRATLVTVLAISAIAIGSLAGCAASTSTSTPAATAGGSVHGKKVSFGHPNLCLLCRAGRGIPGETEKRWRRRNDCHNQL